MKTIGKAGNIAANIIPLLGALVLSGCITVTVDEVLFSGADADLGEYSVVILGRRHASDYETEPDFVACIGKHISRAGQHIEVLPEEDFVNALYPWFEPRTAPLQPADITRLTRVQPVRDKLQELNTKYLVWIDGATVRSEGTGSMACGVAPGAVGCLGFGTWGDDSNYEAVIWDFTNRQEVGRMSATASGRSYMPAVVIPIPIIAPVQGAACNGLGRQLLEFFAG